MSVQPKLELLAARHGLAMVPSEEMPKLAVELLEAGVESEAFANLAGGIRLDHPADLRRLFESGLDECAVRIPTRLEVAEQLKVHLAHQVATEDIRPADGAARIVDIFRIVELELPRSRQYVGEAFGIARLYGLYDSLTDLAHDDTDRRQSIELEILAECRAIAATNTVA